ncbi:MULTISPECIES: amino acid permease [unclassified Limnospira]|uniref:amino acid permease n=1 Tax=unclassified Limnospira TaxID=2642885 RepID=UPI0028E17E97|nr:amino acid permease [Limnospira sp. PMC 1280.21]MDT9318560.1 amino acid permease [Limnospira sp. PMC 1306.21]
MLYIWLERRELESAWGDIRQGIWMALVRMGVFQLSYTPDTKNWRPHILTFSGAPSKRWLLVELASSLSHNRSLFTVSTVLPSGARNQAQRSEMETTIREYLNKRGIRGLVRVIMAPDTFSGAQQLIESYGIGPLVPNTILLGDSQSPERRKSYCETLVHFHKTARSVLILRDESDRGFGARQKIDLGWGGLNTNGGLMLILAYLLRTSLEWRGAEINLNLVVPDETAALAAHTNLAKVVAQLRIGAKPQVIVSQGQPFPEILRSSSQDADLVFLGMATPKEDLQYSKYYEGLQKMATGLPATIFVLAAPDFAFSEVLQKD